VRRRDTVAQSRKAGSSTGREECGVWSITHLFIEEDFHTSVFGTEGQQRGIKAYMTEVTFRRDSTKYE
jgi:hypothetical protein